MSASVRHLPVLDAAPLEIQRPRTRGECVGGERPCLWVSCEHHAIHGVLLGGGGRSLDDDAAVEMIETMPASCTLDVADEGGAESNGDAGTLPGIGALWGVTRERIRQIEGRALKAIKRAAMPLRADLSEDELPEGGAVPVREAAPARAIDWMGDGESPGDDHDAPAAMGAEEDDVSKTAKTVTTAKPAAQGTSAAACCTIHGCSTAPTKARADTPRGTEGLCGGHRAAVGKLTRARGLNVTDAVARVQALARAGVGQQDGPDAIRRALAAAGIAPVPAKPAGAERGKVRVGAPLAPQDSAELALVRQDRDDARARLADAAAREADLRTEVASLRAELAAARAVAPSTTSPWARLDRLAAVLRPGQTIAWSVSSGDPWAASAHALDGAGTVDAWTGEGATPDEAIAALVAAVEGEATARVEAIRAAMEGRS